MARPILTVTEPRFYTTCTTTWALEDLARERGCPFTAIDLDDFRALKWPEVDSPLFVVHAAHLKIAKVTTDGIKNKWGEKTDIICLGSDSIYYTRRYPDRHQGLLVDPRGFEYVRPEKISLHLDLMSEVVDAYRKAGFPAERWHWTASQRGLDLAAEVAREPAPPLTHDVVCYANPDVAAPGGYRKRLTQEMARRGRTVKWGGDTPFVGLDLEILRSIYRAYRSCKVCLGTSSPSWTPCRTAKGWRDWFAPHLGVPLIYDDLPEATDGAWPASGPPPLPVFPYEDWDGLETLLVTDEVMKRSVVPAQKAWAEANTVEKQLGRVFERYGLL